MNVWCLRKGRKLTGHQIPKLKLMKKEKIGQDFIFFILFFFDCEYKELEF